MRVLRETGAREVGITLNIDLVEAASPAPADVAAARRAGTLHNDVWTEPLFAGRYPATEAETWGALADGSYREDGDLALIGAPLDFVGINFYRPLTFADAPHTEPEEEAGAAPSTSGCGRSIRTAAAIRRWAGRSYRRRSPHC